MKTSAKTVQVPTLIGEILLDEDEWERVDDLVRKVSRRPTAKAFKGTIRVKYRVPEEPDLVETVALQLVDREISRQF